ncbi:MAG: alpha-2-macroglobulin family protein [Akkermansiaceae bacterium]
MMKFTQIKCVVLAVLCSLLPFIAQATVVEDRLAMNKLFEDGNWKEALEAAEKNFGAVSDEKSDGDLDLAIKCMNKLRKYEGYEGLLAVVNEKHGANAKVLLEAAHSLSSVPSNGAWFDNEYLRGASPYSRKGTRGEHANSLERDRVRALQLLERAYGLTEANDGVGKLNVLQYWATMVQSNRTHNQSWKLQILTDTGELPEVFRGYNSYSGTQGAPMTDEGDALFYEVPVSYADAENDGERWRWLLDEQVKVDPKHKLSVSRQLAAFLHQQFGVRSMQSFGWYHRMAAEDGEENQAGIMKVHTLKDNETIARLANGVKRFELPDSQNFIKMYEEAWDGGDAYAADRLVEIYLDRRQYDRAAELLGVLIATKGDDKQKSRNKRLEQITSEWGRFEQSGGAFTVVDEKRVSLVYRNAKEVRLTLHEIDVQGINDDIWEYLKGNPRTVDWNRVNWGDLLNTSVNDRHNKYIGDQVAEQVYELKPRGGHWDTRAELKLPKIDKAGAYLLRGEIGDGKKFYTMVWVDDMMLASRQVSGGTLYIAADAETGKPIAGVELIVRGYRTEALKKKSLLRKYNTITTNYEAVTDENGQVILKNGDDSGRNFQWTVEARKGEMRAWMGMNRIWSWHRDQNSEYVTRKAFCITSQPVYKPESEVQGKFWVREVRYDLGDKSAFAGRKFYLEVVDPRGEKVGEGQTIVADEYGGVPFSVDIAHDATLGSYRVVLRFDSATGSHAGNGNFRVEKYKKPEYEVKVDAPTIPVELGDAFEATVKANYYHGAPVTNATVKVKVLRHVHNARWFPYGRWDWLYGGGYGWMDVERSWYPGWAHWGCRSPYPFWYGGNHEQPELVLDEEMKIGEDGTVKVKVDSALAKLVHGDEDHRYEIKVEVVDASRRTIFGSGSVLATRKPFQVTTWLNRGYALAGERIQASVAANTLDGRVVKGWMGTTLYKVNSNAEGEIKETVVRQWDKVAYSGETARLDFKVDVAGQYRLVNLVTDEQGREVEGAILFSVRGPAGEQGDVRYNDIELITDKRTYAPGESVKLLVNTKRKGSTVMLFVRGTGDRKLLTLEGNSQVVEIPVALGDMPNFFVEAMTISDARVHTQVLEVIVPPAKRVLNVAIVPSSEKYKPQEKGTVKIKVTDENGEAVTGDCVLAVYDKSLEYISGGSNVAKIKSFFWKWRRQYQRGYWRQSMVIAGGNTVKKGSEMMGNLGAFGQQLSLELAGGDPFGDAGGGGGVRFSKKSQSAVMGRAAGNLAMPTPSAAVMESDSLSAEAFSAGGEMDEADGGNEPEVMIRKDFADLIKWSGSVKLDEDGMAEVPVEYPDNLTTWKIQTWAMAHGTRVGHGSAEVITSKDLIIRLQAPRFFVEKDEVVLSAVVHNYHAAAADAEVSLELEGGTLDVIEGDISQGVRLAGENGEERVNWRVKVKGEGEAIVRMKVVTANDADAMEMTFPVYVHGILKQMAWSREVEPGKDSAKIIIEVPEERRPEDSRLEVRFSPTIAGAIVDALPYLAEYPYGCTEQTLNRFVPTVITQKILKDMGINLEDVRNKRTNLNPQEMGDDKERAKQWKRWQRNPVFSEKEVDKMTREGVQKLIDMQVSDGGWGWFSGYGERSYPHTTAVVVHGLRLAQKNGAQVPEERIKLGVEWLKRYEARETERIRMWKKREKNTKQGPETMDVFVRLVLAENEVSNQEMLGYQFRDKKDFGVYAKSMLGMSLHLAKDVTRRDEVIRNIEQFLNYDDENQTAFLEMGNSGYWWYWYGSDIEAHAWYLKLLVLAKPESKQARGVVKFLVNNRKHATYWNSTRDTAYAIEAIAAYMEASGEADPNAEVEVLVDGKSYKKVKISKENLFSFDNKMTLAGDVLTSGKHTVEIRRKGNGPLYTNAYLTVFTKEDFIEKAGLEVKVERRFYKLVPKKATDKVAGNHGQVVEQKVDKYDRVPLKVGDAVQSGDTIEVELLLESKNDYEYLMFSDFKAAGTEAEEVRSGYTRTGNVSAYMEVHDEKVCFFIRKLPQGKHSLSYKLRAEIPGKFSALPATADAMYAPELRANSDEMKIEIGE